MIKRLLVYTFGDQSHKSTIETAARLASQHDASLTGLFVRPDMMGYTSTFGAYPINLAQNYYDVQADFAKRAKTEFDSVVSATGIRHAWHEVHEYEQKPRPSSYVDMIFISQPDATSKVIFNDTDFVDQIITETGLPVVVVPKTWEQNQFASKPVLAWRESKEAVGAVRHALPLMRQAKQVDVVSVVPAPNADNDLINGVEICEYLCEHLVNAEFFAQPRDSGDSDDASALFRHVNNSGNDLIVAGGYSHSRIREIVLGGMTRALIKHSPVPVLFSH